MDADRRNDTGIFRYTDVEYTPEGHTDAYRWDDFLGIAGGHVYSAMGYHRYGIDRRPVRGG